LPAKAKETRSWWIDRDPGRQYLFVPRAQDHGGPANSSSELIQKWHARFLELRRGQAARCFELARREVDRGSGAAAYQLLHEVLHEDPGHAEARRILAWPGDSGPPRSRPPRSPHPQFGWARGRWWNVESAHFQIATDLSSEAGLELARRLETFYAVWRQVFFDYWNNAVSLREQFASNHAPPPRSLRKHQVVLFRDRQEYLARLASAESQIAITRGYYHKASQTSYFHAGDDLLPVWYHEAAHQLFQETGSPVRDVGEKWNFWIVEGIAVYLESLVDRGEFCTLGGFDADRLQFARSRVLGGEPPLPLNQLFRLGREDLQRHPEIGKLYSQSAGLTHFFMDVEHGKFRDAFLRSIAAVYAGTDSPETFAALWPLSPAELDDAWKTFLTPRAAELRYLGPPDRRLNLSLIRSDARDSALARLADSHRLEWLDLSFTQVTDQGMAHLAALPRLRRLALVGTRIGDSAAPHLARLAALEELDLSGSAITDDALASLARLTQLNVLRLSHTAISDGGLAQLAALKNLEELDVDATRVTPEALSRLKEKLPLLK
jgi:hypothetical protein